MADDDPRIQQLLEELLDGQATPEEVCGECPELLPAVRERWQRICRARAEVKAMFPTEPARAAPTFLSADGQPLPAIPGYEIQGVLGRGGMGVVYKARHLALKRTVALKMLATGHPDAAERARFTAEAEAVARLQHPNVVQIHEVGEADGRPFFALEYVAGGSLADRLTGQPLPPRDAARLVASLAEAMHLAHSRNLVHRDLKPGNVLMAGEAGTPAGQCQPKVTDFGLVRQLDAASGQTFAGLILGTPSYMAPEQAEGRAHSAGPAADVWALGAILYECLTGRPPFKGATPHETLEQVRGREPAAPSSLNRQAPRDLETICLKCLRKQPERRYSSAKELGDDLGRFLRGEPVTARPVGVAERVRKWVWRRPALAGLLAAVVLLAAGGGAGAWQLSQQRAAARDHQARTDQDVRKALDQARATLEKGWQAADLAILTEAAAEGNRAEGMARSGGASAPVREEVEAFRNDARARLGRAEKNRALLKALLDVSDPHETPLTIALARPSQDEQYATAFRRWGLDVDRTPVDEVVARLGAEPGPVVREMVAGLDVWMQERRRQGKRPESDWRRLYRVADQLDRSERHRRLRQLLVSGPPPRPESVACLVGAGLPHWAALWELARGASWRELRTIRGEIDPASEPVMTVLLLSRAYAAVGDVAGAEQVLREAAAGRPDQVVLLDALGKLLERQGAVQRARALEYHRAARTARPGLGIVSSMALIRAGRADEAEEILRALIRQQPENTLLYHTLGYSLFIRKQFAAAEAAFRKATEIPPDLTEAHYNLGLTLARQGRHAAAEAAFRKAIELEPDFTPSYNHLALALSQQQKHAAAEAVCRKAIELEPDSPLAHNSLGLALVGQEKYRAAEESCRRAIALAPGLANAYTNLGNALRGQGDLAAGEAAHRKAIALAPDLADAHNNLGVVLASQQKYRDGEAAFRKAIELEPNFAEPHCGLGLLLADQGQHVAAEAAFRKAIDRRPDFVGACLHLGRVLMLQAKFDEALTFLEKGRELLPARAPLREQAQPMVERCKHWIALKARLPGVLKGTEKPANAAEQVEFAQLCLLEKLYAGAARL
jgi:serine/threonine-protein kinase